MGELLPPLFGTAGTAPVQPPPPLRLYGCPALPLDEEDDGDCWADAEGPLLPPEAVPCFLLSRKSCEKKKKVVKGRGDEPVFLLPGAFV